MMRISMRYWSPLRLICVLTLPASAGAEIGPDGLPDECTFEEGPVAKPSDQIAGTGGRQAEHTAPRVNRCKGATKGKRCGPRRGHNGKGPCRKRNAAGKRRCSRCLMTRAHL
jgi:hypothetical protein